MSMLNDVGAAFSLWIDGLARMIGTRLEAFGSVRRLEVVEADDGTFTISPTPSARGGDLPTERCRVRIVDGAVVDELSPDWTAALRGSRIDIVLKSARFLFRPLDLPKKASEFLDGIIRSQIDRLTPWPPHDAAYHWTPPQESSGDRITTTIVASAKAGIAAIVQAFTDLGAASVAVATRLEPGGAERVTVLTQQVGRGGTFVRVRLALLAVFVVTAVGAVLSFGAAGFLADHYDAERQQVQRRINERRAVLRAGQTGQATTVYDGLARRKHATPASVMVLDALSALLPDHTYATELRIEGQKVQVIGFTRDAASLISILEQSPHFARAAFFAPTTRAPNEPGERFHIEVRARPYFGSGT